MTRLEGLSVEGMSPVFLDYLIHAVLRYDVAGGLDDGTVGRVVEHVPGDSALVAFISKKKLN